jgi:hypothetical protein
VWLAKLAAGAVFVGAFLIEIPSWGSASLIEIVWTLIGVGVIGVSLYALPRVVADWKLAKRGQRGPAMTLLARGHIEREFLRLAQGFIILAVGIYAAITPSIVPGPVVISLTGLVITAGLLLLGVLVAVQSIRDRQRRTAAERILRREP